MDVIVGLYKESWVPKNWCFWAVVLEKTLESPLDCKGIQPVHSEGDQSWVFIGKTDAKAETPVLWPPREELTHWKRLWCWEGLRAGREGDDRGWDGWLASLAWWTWVWVNWEASPEAYRFVQLRATERWHTTAQKHQFFGTQLSLYSPTITSIHDYWKSHSFD